jgi:branched-chain amino acid transport system ATP-binding protein
MLNVKNLEAGYGEILIIREVSLNIKRGEIVGLIGPNGAGKTTLLKTISGILKPKSGEIYFENIRIDKLPPYKITELGISHVPEGGHIFPNLTVMENIEVWALHKKAREKFADTLEWIFQVFPRLKERRKQVAGTLSGGERRMLAIANALIQRPKLLLIDELSFGLAPKLVTELFNKLKELNESGITILLVEQNVVRALELCNRAYVLETGKIVLEGFTKELQNNEMIRKAYLGL